MSMRGLKFEEIRDRAEKFRDIIESFEDEISSGEREKFLAENPLAPLIATICDERIKAEHACDFPLWLYTQLGKGYLSADLILEIGKDRIRNLLQTFMEGKWPSEMTEKDRESYLKKISSSIFDACKKIYHQYDNNPDNLFKKGKYKSPEIYFILRELPGIGPKKASMVARDFAKGSSPWFKGLSKRLKEKGIEFKVTGVFLTSVPIDVHVVKVFTRIMYGFRYPPRRSKFLDHYPDIQHFAKLAYPEFPGRVDDILWSVGRKYCDARQPNCEGCPLRDLPCEYAKRYRCPTDPR